MADDYSTDDFDDYLTEQLKDPEFRAAYDDAGARESLLDELTTMRKAAGLTQTEAARRMGITQPTLSGIENEGSDPRISTVQRYARTLGARLDLTLSPKVLSALRCEDAARSILEIHTCQAGYCSECGGTWPCATVRALTEEDQK